MGTGLMHARRDIVGFLFFLVGWANRLRRVVVFADFPDTGTASQNSEFPRAKTPDSEVFSRAPRKRFVVKKHRSNMVLQARIRPNTFWLDTLWSAP
ncbi:hypothetical protein [Paraburkholderia sp.]|uniref:hypothetical protein n=1 Tax=Paraburkholderia sp. TaxID=1926495 RepID=UPI002F415AC8